MKTQIESGYCEKTKFKSFDVSLLFCNNVISLAHRVITKIQMLCLTTKHQTNFSQQHAICCKQGKQDLRRFVRLGILNFACINKFITIWSTCKGNFTDYRNISTSNSIKTIKQYSLLRPPRLYKSCCFGEKNN